MHYAWLPLKDAARLSYVIANCILPEVRFAVNWIGDQPSNSERGVLADKHIRQETSPFGPSLTLWLRWQLVIRDSSGHAISLRRQTGGFSGKVMTLIACVFIWGSSWPCCFPKHTISVFFYNNREGPLQTLLKPSLCISHIMVSGDTVCPQGTSSAHHVATLAGLKTCR
jgi:hypothetical protein